MKKIIFITVLFFSLLSFGQAPNDKVIYLDSLKKETDSANAVTKRVIKEYYLEKESYTLEEFQENKILFTAQVSNKNVLIKNGAYTSYYKNGNKSKTGNYEKNLEVGNSTEWYENGAIKGEFNYVINKFDSDKSILNFWDEDGIQKVKDGNGDYLFDIGIMLYEEVIIRGKVENGLLVGKWNTNPKEFPYFEEFYANGKLLNGVRKYANNKSIYYTEVHTFPKPEGGMNEFRAMIGSKIKTKKQKSAIEGTIIARFFVDPEGKIQEPMIVKGLNDYFDNQLLNILTKSEKWTPGFHRGVAVKCYYSLPVLIKIEESN